MRVGQMKAVAARTPVAEECCFCVAAIPQGEKAVKFVERTGAHAVSVTFGCLPCWREMGKDFDAIPAPTTIPQPTEPRES